MKRPSLYILIFAIAVIIAGTNNILLYLSPFMAGIIVYVFFKTKRRAFALCLFVISVFVALNCMIRMDYKPNISRYDSLSVRLTLRVEGYPDISDDKQSAVCSIQGGPFDTKDEKILVNFYNQSEEDNINLSTGSVIEADCLILMPSVKRNPGGFDYSMYLKTKSIYAYAEASNAVFIERQTTFFSVLYDIRESLSDVMSKYMDNQNASVAKSIIFGCDDLDEFTLEDFRVVGIAHMLAVSGLHTGILFMVLSYILNLFKADKRTRCVTTILVLFCYCALTGFLISVIRASLMISFVLIGSCLGKRSDRFNSVCLAGLLIIVVNPLSIYSVSFVLSFFSVMVIILIMPYVNNIIYKYVSNKRIRSVCTFGVCCFVVSVMLIPLNACYFNTVSYIAPIANIFTVPLVGVIITLVCLGLCLSFAPVLSSFVFKLCALLLSYMRYCAGFFSSISFAGGYMKALRPYEVIAFYIIVFSVFGYLGFKHKRQKRALIIMLFAMLLSIGYSIINNFTAKIDFLDVGFGDCCVITTSKGKHIMIDTAKEYYSDVIVDYLECEDIHNLEYVIITHSDSDHAGGLCEIIKRVSIGNIVMNDDGSELYAQIKEKAYKNGINVLSAYRGDIISFEGFESYVISPDREAYYTDLNDNERSIVCSVYENNVCILMCADMTDSVMHKLLNDIYPFDVDIMKAAHHGSYSIYTEEFFEKFNVRNTVISVGKNYYGLPNTKATNIYSRSPLYLTQDCGCVRVVFTGNKSYKIKTAIGE